MCDMTRVPCVTCIESQMCQEKVWTTSHFYSFWGNLFNDSFGLPRSSRCSQGMAAKRTAEQGLFVREVN